MYAHSNQVGFQLQDMYSLIALEHSRGGKGSGSASNNSHMPIINNFK